MAASAQHTIDFAITGPIARSDLAGLCDRVCALLRESRASVALCDVRGIDPDAVTVDALARLQPLAADGLVRIEPGRITVSPHGRLLLRNIAMCFDRYLDQPVAVAAPRFSRSI